MLSLTNQEVEKIASPLLKGMICFYQLDSKKIYSLPDDEDYFNYDLTPEEEDILDQVEEHPENFAEFTTMEQSQELFLMDTFASRMVKERKLQEELIDALSKAKAGTSFKYLINNSHYRNQWKTFRLEKYKDWVLEQVDSFNYTEE